jgi:molybdopterin molybdotransferase
MISVREGQERILAHISKATAPEIVSAPEALGRVLADLLTAPFDVPPTDNSAVDGYAVNSADVPAQGTRELTVVADLPAGSVYDGILRPGEALRIMTGAPMPAGADTVYPQEVVVRVEPRQKPVLRVEPRAGGETSEIHDPKRDEARVRVGPIDKGANVRMRGEDMERGAIVIEAGSVLRPQEIGVITSLGIWQVAVHRRPCVALLSTGDEIVEPGVARNPGQIYDSNRFTLHGALRQCGADVVDLGIVSDARDALRDRLLEASRSVDFVLTSGGVSVGTHDFVKDVLDEVGAIDFWQVAMQPGRPLAVGRVGETPFFGLPGNPVASLLAFMLFVRPALYKRAGRRRLFPDTWQARVTQPLRKKVGRREFKRGVMRFAENGWEVRTTGPQGSGILTSMVAGNCLIVLEEERGDVAPGELVTVEPF